MRFFPSKSASPRRLVAKLRQKGLIGKRLGRGYFSTVYETADPNVVFKLTKCLVSVRYARLVRRYYPDDPHLLHAQRIHGRMCVEERDCDAPVFGMSLERLVPITTKVSVEEFRLAKALSSSTSFAMNREEQIQALEDIVRRGNLPLSILRSIERLQTLMVVCEGASLDLHIHNFMVRPSTGELVISDPFVDADLISSD